MIRLVFLTAVAVLYAGLAIWCSVSPAETSSKVGFTLQPGTGESEFLTVYGGLEMGLAVMLLWPWVRREYAASAVWNCLLIHGCLVLFRSIGFFLYSDIGRMTYQLAIGEWVIFLLSLAVVRWFPDRSTSR